MTNSTIFQKLEVSGSQLQCNRGRKVLISLDGVFAERDQIRTIPITVDEADGRYRKNSSIIDIPSSDKYEIVETHQAYPFRHIVIYSAYHEQHSIVNHGTMIRWAASANPLVS